MVPPLKPTIALSLALAALASARPAAAPTGLRQGDLHINDEGVLLLKRSGALAPARAEVRKRADLLSGLLDGTTTTAADASTTAADTTSSAAATTTTSAAASTTTDATTTTPAASTTSNAETTSAAMTTTSAAQSSDTNTKTTATSTSASNTVVTTSSIITSLVTNSDGSVSTQTSASVGTATQSAAAASNKSSSSSSGKTWGIVGGVAGGVVALAAIIFIAWKCSQRRFSSLDDDDANIKWPELQRDGEGPLNPSATHRTGGAGIEMGERRGSDEWDAQEPFFPPQHDGRMSPAPGAAGYGAGAGHSYNGSYDPYLGAGGANAYPPHPAAQGYYDPYQQPAFADSRGNAIGGNSPVPSYGFAGAAGGYAEEKEEVGQHEHASRRGSRTLSQMELASPEQARNAALPPSRSQTYDEKPF